MPEQNNESFVKQDAIICDLDGTLADCSHRLHFINGTIKNWDAFFNNSENDTLIKPVALFLYTILDIQQALGIWSAPRILFVTGRPEKNREMTTKWLQDNYFPIAVEPWQEAQNCPALYMRADGDFRSDFIIKSEILDKIQHEYNVIYVIDDRPSVIDMWRKRGLFVFQVGSHWESVPETDNLGRLTLMVGPTGAGKTTFLHKVAVISQYHIREEQIVSSDRIREEIFGDFRNQSDNDRIFKILHNLARARIQSGLDCVIDATNLRRSDRRAAIDATGAKDIRYIVIDRPLEEKLNHAGWRNDFPGLIERHHNRFQSGLKEILSGDGLGAKIIDLRRMV